MACAGASGVMNFAAANDASPKSVLAYVMPPVFLAVVADRVVSVARRHVLGEDERSPWLGVAAVVLYALRLVLAPPSTAAGLRRWLLLKTPLPAPRAPAVTPAPQPKAIGGRPGPAGPLAESKTARFLALVAERHGPRSASRPSGFRTCTELARGRPDPGAARTARAGRPGRAGGGGTGDPHLVHHLPWQSSSPWPPAKWAFWPTGTCRSTGSGTRGSGCGCACTRAGVSRPRLSAG
jgi:hypothetical protein